MKGKYGEPWASIHAGLNLHTGGRALMIDYEIATDEQQDRAIACVNCLDGIPDEALEKIQRGEWQIVPREPTEEMIEAAKNTVRAWTPSRDGLHPIERLYVKIYHAQLDAAPKVTK